MKLTFYILTLILLLNGCYRDKGNYTLKDYQRIVSIQGALPGPITLDDSCNITPIITWKNPTGDTSAFDFEWYVLDSLVSTERNLRLAPYQTGTQLIRFFAIERATKIKTRHLTSMVVNSPYKTGYLLLTNNNGQSGISFVRRDKKLDANNVVYYEHRVFKDLYNTLHPRDDLGTNPTRIYSHVLTDYTKDDFLLLQNGSGSFFDGESYSKKLSLEHLFNGSVYPDNAKVVDFRDGGAVVLALTDDGRLYFKKTSGTFGTYDNTFIPDHIYFEKDSHISQIIETIQHSAGFIYLYDQLHKRFLGLYTSNGSHAGTGGKRYINNIINPNSPPPNGWIPLEGHPNHELIYCSDYNAGRSYVNIMKSLQTGEYIYQTYNLVQNVSASTLNVTLQAQWVFEGSSLINDQTVFKRIRNSSYLFFTSGAKLYFYDVNTKLIKLYYDFGASNITKLMTDANSGELALAFENGDFVICSLANALLGDATPGDRGILFRTQGLGNIIDLKWKFGSYNEYNLQRYPT